MSTKKASPVTPWSEAEKHLSKSCPIMKGLVQSAGPCTLAPRRDYFVKLCQSIFSQQLSTKVAKVLFGRFCDQFPRRTPTPAKVVEFLKSADEETVRKTGLSRQKRAYIADLAAHFASGAVPTRRFARMDDDAIVQSLIQVNGIGRWTVEMFLIFCLNRPDVWPVDDFGVKKNAQLAYGLKQLPGKKELTALGEKWRPYRTLAAWYLWRRGDGQ